MEREWIRRLRDLGYSEYEAARTAEKIDRMEPETRELLEQWFQTGRLPGEPLKGFTVEELVDQRGMTVPAAFLFLDWMGREPEQAAEALASMPDQVIVRQE